MADWLEWVLWPCVQQTAGSFLILLQTKYIPRKTLANQANGKSFAIFYLTIIFQNQFQLYIHVIRSLIFYSQISPITNGLPLQHFPMCSIPQLVDYSSVQSGAVVTPMYASQWQRIFSLLALTRVQFLHVVCQLSRQSMVLITPRS